MKHRRTDTSPSWSS